MHFSRKSAINLDTNLFEALHVPDTREFLFKQEERFLRFIEDVKMKKYQLEPMDPSQRLLAHKLAERFFFDSPSVGEGSERHLVLVKTDRSRPPLKLIWDHWRKLERKRNSKKPFDVGQKAKEKGNLLRTIQRPNVVDIASLRAVPVRDQFVPIGGASGLGLTANSFASSVPLPKAGDWTFDFNMSDANKEPVRFCDIDRVGTLPLKREWAFWFSVKEVKNNSSYFQGAEEVSTFKTIGSFWQCMNHLPSPLDMRVHAKFFLVLNGLLPRSTSALQLTSYWQFYLPIDLSELMFTNLVLTVVGQAGLEVAGVSLHKEDESLMSLKIWEHEGNAQTGSSLQQLYQTEPSYHEYWDTTSIDDQRRLIYSALMRISQLDQAVQTECDGVIEKVMDIKTQMQLKHPELRQAEEIRTREYLEHVAAEKAEQERIAREKTEKEQAAWQEARRIEMERQEREREEREKEERELEERRIALEKESAERERAHREVQERVAKQLQAVAEEQQKLSAEADRLQREEAEKRRKIEDELNREKRAKDEAKMAKLVEQQLRLEKEAKERIERGKQFVQRNCQTFKDSVVEKSSGENDSRRSGEKENLVLADWDEAKRLEWEEQKLRDTLLKEAAEKSRREKERKEKEQAERERRVREDRERLNANGTAEKLRRDREEVARLQRQIAENEEREAREQAEEAERERERELAKKANKERERAARNREKEQRGREKERHHDDDEHYAKGSSKRRGDAGSDEDYADNRYHSHNHHHHRHNHGENERDRDERDHYHHDEGKQEREKSQHRRHSHRNHESDYEMRPLNGHEKLDIQKNFFAACLSLLPITESVRGVLCVCRQWQKFLVPRVLLRDFPLCPETLASAKRLLRLGNKLSSVRLLLPVSQMEALFDTAVPQKLHHLSLAGKVYATSKEKRSKLKRASDGTILSFDTELKSIFSRNMSKVLESLELQFTIRPQDEEFTPSVVELTGHLLYLEHLKLASVDVLKLQLFQNSIRLEELKRLVSFDVGETTTCLKSYCKLDFSECTNLEYLRTVYFKRQKQLLFENLKTLSLICVEHVGHPNFLLHAPQLEKLELEFECPTPEDEEMEYRIDLTKNHSEFYLQLAQVRTLTSLTLRTSVRLDGVKCLCELKSLTSLEFYSVVSEGGGLGRLLKSLKYLTNLRVVMCAQETLLDVGMASRSLSNLTVHFSYNVKKLDFSPLLNLQRLKYLTCSGAISSLNLKKMKQCFDSKFADYEHVTYDDGNVMLRFFPFFD